MILAAVSALLLAQADTVLVISSPDEAWRPFEERLAAELRAGGFEVRVLDVHVDPAGDVPAQLRLQCKDQDAIAALWLFARDDGRVDAWVADALTEKAVLRTYDQPTNGAERARLALQAVELLHASLLEIRLKTTAAPGEPQVPRFSNKPVEKPHLVFGTGVGVAVTPGMSPQPLLELQLGYEFRHGVTAEVQGITSVFPAQIGVAQFRTQVLWAPLRGRVLSAGLALGTGLALTWAGGATDSTRVAWLFACGLVLSARLNEGIRLQVLTNAAVTVPEMAYRIDALTVVTVGRPIIDALLRLEFE